MTQNIAAFFVINEKTVFIPLRYIYPECSVLISTSPQLHPLFCLSHDQCPANNNCMDTLVRRVNYFFTEVAPKAQLMVAYFSHADRPESLRAGLFFRDLSEPRLIVANRSAFQKFQTEGKHFTWIPPVDYYNISAPTGIIPVEKLIKGNNG